MIVKRITIILLTILASLFLTAGGCSPDEPDNSTTRTAKIYLVQGNGNCIIDFSNPNIKINLEIKNIDGATIEEEKFTKSSIKSDSKGNYVEATVIPKSGNFGIAITVSGYCDECCSPLGNPFFSGVASDPDNRYATYTVILNHLTCISGCFSAISTSQYK